VDNQAILGEKVSEERSIRTYTNSEDASDIVW